MTDDEEIVRPSVEDSGGGFGGRWGAAGVPLERSKDTKGSTQRLAARLRPQSALVAVVLFLAVASVVLAVIAPKILGSATNVIVDGVISGKGIDFTELHRILLGVLAIYVTAAVLSYLQGYLLAGVVQRAMFTLRADVEDKLHHLPLSYVDRQPRGDLLSRVTNDIDNVAQSLQQTLSQLLTSVLTIVGVLVMMISISPLLSLIAVVTIPVAVFTMKSITKRSKAYFIEQWAHTGALERAGRRGVHRSLDRQGLRTPTRGRSDLPSEERGVVRRRTPRPVRVGDHPARDDVLRQPQLRGDRVDRRTAGVVGADDDRRNPGVHPVLAPVHPAAHPARFDDQCDAVGAGVGRARVRVARRGRAVARRCSAARRSRPAGRVEFEHVSFSYDPTHPLITDLSLVAEPGQTVAIVGPTGAGKTTLVNLIMRFYEIDGGAITLDGNDTAHMRRRELRSNIGMVLQDTWLFGGTIRENIAYGNLDATDDEIIAAARRPSSTASCTRSRTGTAR